MAAPVQARAVAEQPPLPKHASAAQVVPLRGSGFSNPGIKLCSKLLSAHTADGPLVRNKPLIAQRLEGGIAGREVTNLTHFLDVTMKQFTEGKNQLLVGRINIRNNLWQSLRTTAWKRQLLCKVCVLPRELHQNKLPSQQRTQGHGSPRCSDLGQLCSTALLPLGACVKPSRWRLAQG